VVLSISHEHIKSNKKHVNVITDIIFITSSN
jgi:hypothetical protein